MTDTPKLTNVEQQYFDILTEATEPVMRGTLEMIHDSAYNSNVVDVHMMNLRRKLEGVYTIETIRGVGYKMTKI